MAVPNEIVSTVVTELQTDSRLPSAINYLNDEADLTGADAGVKLPVIEVQILTTDELTNWNTDKYSVITDSDGNEVGFQFRKEYQMAMQVAVWVAEGGQYDTDEIGSTVREILYSYDSSGPNLTLHQDVWRFELSTGNRNDETNRTPTVRKWTQQIDCWAYEVYETTESSIEAVSLPSDENVVQ